MHFGTHPVVGWAGHPHHSFLLRKAEVIGSGFSALGLEGHMRWFRAGGHTAVLNSPYCTCISLHLCFLLLPKKLSYNKQKI